MDTSGFCVNSSMVMGSVKLYEMYVSLCKPVCRGGAGALQHKRRQKFAKSGHGARSLRVGDAHAHLPIPMGKGDSMGMHVTM